MPDTVGRATALNMVLPVRRGAAGWLRAWFWTAQRVGYVTAPLRRLSFIQFARWSIIDGPGGRPWLWFESNFDGDLPVYMDTFARAVPWRMRSVWGAAEGFPGLSPMAAFKTWVDANSVETGHYWSAYPEATTTMAGAASRVLDRFERLRAEVNGADATHFATAYEAFLVDSQGDL